MKKKWIAILICAAIVVSLCACKADQPEVDTTENTTSQSQTETETETTTVPTTETTTESTTQKLALSIACPESKEGILAHNAVGTMTAEFNKEGYAAGSVKWQSSAPQVLRVDESGQYQAVGVGKATITATIAVGDETATKSIDYSVQKLATGAVFNTNAIELKAGFRTPIGARATPEDATDVSIYWGNSNARIAAIEGGEVVGYQPGSCVLTAYNNRGDTLGTVDVNILPGMIYGSDADFGNQIVEFATTFSNKPNRTTNLKIASGKISGIVLQPGQQFSFNGVVGPRTVEAGYLNAGVYNGGKEEQGLAGGICQVSTTLFNAVLRANLQIDQRSQHSMWPGYVEYGRDAAIQWPSTDLKFTNTLTVPIRIVFQFTGNQIITRIFTPGEESYPLPEVRIESGGDLNCWMKRYVNGEVNYSCTTKYLPHS